MPSAPGSPGWPGSARGCGTRRGSRLWYLIQARHLRQAPTNYSSDRDERAGFPAWRWPPMGKKDISLARPGRRGASRGYREDSGSLPTLWRGQRSAIPVTRHGLPGLPRLRRSPRHFNVCRARRLRGRGSALGSPRAPVVGWAHDARLRSRARRPHGHHAPLRPNGSGASGHEIPVGGQQPHDYGSDGEGARTLRLRDRLSRPSQPATTAPPVKPVASRLRSAGPPGPSTAAGAAAAFLPQARGYRQ